MENVSFFSRNALDLSRWDAFVGQSPMGSIYARSWYLDAVCGGSWGAVILKKEDAWLAVLPIPLGQKWGIRYSLQPSFCQYSGLICAPFFFETRHRETHFLKTVIAQICRAIPPELWVVEFCLHPDWRYFLPFEWQKMNVRPRSTARLMVNRPIEMLFSELSTSVRNSLKKAGQVDFFCQKSADALADLLQIQVGKAAFTASERVLFSKLWAEVAAREAGFCLSIKSRSGNCAAVGMFLKSGNRLIFIAAAVSPQGRSGGAGARLVWEGICLANRLPGIEIFDFEGSMIEPVEAFFRGFNAEPVVYFQVRRNRLGPILGWYRAIFCVSKADRI